MMTLLAHVVRLLVSFLFMNTAQRFLPVKGKWIWQLLFFLSCWLGANTVILIGDPWNIILILPVFLVGFFLCCEGTIAAKLTMGLIFFAISISLSAVIDTGIHLVGYYLGDVGNPVMLRLILPQLEVMGFSTIEAVPQEDFAALSIFALNRLGVQAWLRLISWAIIWLFFRKLKLTEAAELSPQIWRLVDVLALFPTVTVFAMVALQTFGMVLDTNASFLPTITILPFAFLSSLGLLYAVSVLVRHEKLEKQQALWQIRAGYYSLLEQTQLQVRYLRHDMANHLHTMDVLDNDGMRAYLRELLASPAMTGNLRVCDNDIVNAVITSKTLRLEEEGIQTKIEVDIPKELAVADIDLCALFANALDNAIEACGKLPADQRFIRMSTVADKGLLMLRVENAAAAAPITKDGQIVTSKKNQAAHGFGLASIRDIVEKYDGTMETEYRDGIFLLSCTMMTAV
ncbi:GHKL domain-containing protein [Enterococcus sp. 669A]|uniref:GHKL domain-containing protein n=1 Tax=Candidatus Enterococcus moelleringii TaxID=2815325 RepID=A0ABS3LE84_9ENTE|nr:sensor histidine kinase [Enterococcus sp. 669A]MBO1307942.1 GHKL domain-containing protein [Enterococcus sp. 669A]